VVGTETGVPLVFMQHFRGGMDYWDPAVTDGFARDHAGVAGSSGETPDTIDGMADHTQDFVRALGPSSRETMAAQSAAAVAWREVRGERFAELASIASPTLVVNGHTDVTIPTINSYWLSQHIPRAQLIIYPDSGHGALFQYAELFLTHARIFLDATEPWQ
jgi:pimeloyl-ACP methyl ester carboxylesterase